MRNNDNNYLPDELAAGTTRAARAAGRFPARRIVSGALVAGLALALGACGSDDDDDDHHEPPPPAAQTPKTCQEMAGLTVPAEAIGLPTTGASVTEATVVAASGTGAQAIGEYCRVLGAIRPVDPNAPEIRFQLNLPVSWNNKVMMFGGGGYNGTIPSPAQNVPAGPANQPTPLGRGYATFASDSGHQAGALGSRDGSFGVNDEAVRNFSGDALKKTRDTAMHLIKARYAVDGPRKAYFAGGSTGGREALAVVQRWPQDWDGAIVLYPAWNAASLDLQMGRITRAMALPGGYLNAAERRTLFDASLQACDTLDGVQDGVVSNTAQCNATFNPATATLNGAPLRCEGGADTGDTCLSDPQILSLNTYNTPINFSYPLGSGETQYPGFNLWGSDLGMAGLSPVQATVIALALNLEQPASPMPNTAPYFSVFWDQWVRYFVTRDPNFNSLTLDPENPGPWQARISELTALQDVNKTDLTAFAIKGGKVLMAHGTNDVLVSSRATVQYYERVRQTMGKDLVGKFLRYYEIPGYGHAASTVFNASWDSLTTLEQWVEGGTEPPAQIVADTVGVPGRTRPLCEYPGWPKYNGGDVNAAASYSCVKE